MPCPGQPGGDALEVFNQPQPQHNGNGPQFAQLQGTGRLVCRDEGVERFRVNLRIHVRNQFQHDVIDARKSGGWAVQEARQLPAIAAGQVPSGQLNLLLDQVKIVQQPFGGGGDAPPWIDRHCGAIEGSEDVLVLGQPGQQTIGPAPGDHLMMSCQCFRMARQLFNTKQLRPQRRLVRAGARTRVSSPPILKQQWRILHVVRACNRDSSRQPPCRNSSALATATLMKITLSPARRYGVFPPSAMAQGPCRISSLSAAI